MKHDENYDSDDDYDGSGIGVVDDDMMTKWLVTAEWVCAKGSTTRVFIMESRLIYSLRSPHQLYIPFANTLHFTNALRCNYKQCC